MSLDLEYYRAMRYRTPVLTVFLIVLSALGASAQVNGVPPSVTSFGFGGRQRFNGPPPSVTSLGPKGVTPPRVEMHQLPPHRSGMHHHQHQGNVYPYYVPYYVPYYPAEAYDGPADQAMPDQQDDPRRIRAAPQFSTVAVPALARSTTTPPIHRELCRPDLPPRYRLLPRAHSRPSPPVHQNLPRCRKSPLNLQPS